MLEKKEYRGRKGLRNSKWENWNKERIGNNEYGKMGRKKRQETMNIGKWEKGKHRKQ